MNLNKIMIIGRLGKEADIKTMQNGGLVCNLSIVTETRWKKDGEMQSKSEWHKVVTFDENLINYIQSYVNVGDTLYVEGKLTYRLIEPAENTTGAKIKIAEISVGKFDGHISVFKRKKSDDYTAQAETTPEGSKKRQKVEEDIPFDI